MNDTRGSRITISRIALAALFAVAFGPAATGGPSWAASPGEFMLSSSSGAAISVKLVGLPGGAPLLDDGNGRWVLELGPVSYGGFSRGPEVAVGRGPRSFVVSTTFGVEVNDPGGRLRAATLLASLASSSSRLVVRIDGIRLQTVPTRLGARVTEGLVTRHHLELEIPTDMNENDAPAASIQFSAVPE
jgi:hypothetical protein